MITFTFPENVTHSSTVHIWAILFWPIYSMYFHSQSRYCSGSRWGRVRRPCEWGRHFGEGGTGSPRREEGASVEPGQGKREDVIRDRMRRRQEDEEDDPCMASGCQHAQSELMCTARKTKMNVLVMYIFVYLLYLLFQENKSFGASTICIHPLM